MKLTKLVLEYPGALTPRPKDEWDKNQDDFKERQKKRYVIETINELILEAAMESVEEILNSHWFGWEDCSFKYIEEEEYDDNMIVYLYGDRGGISIDFIYQKDYQDDEDDIEYYENMKEDPSTIAVVENGVVQNM